MSSSPDRSGGERVAEFVHFLRLGRKLARLGADVPSRLRLLTAPPIMALSAGKRLGRPVRVTLADVAASPALLHLYEFLLLEQLFLREEYAVSMPAAPELIVDAGSNVGLSILYFRMRYPTARIIGIEPDRANYARCMANVRGVPRVEILPVALSRADGAQGFARAAEGWGSRTTDGDAEEQVPTLGLSSILDRSGRPEIDLLKIDIEGAEFDVIHPEQDLRFVNTIVGEGHLDLARGGTMETFEAALQGFELSLEWLSPDRFVFTAYRRRDGHGDG